MYVYSSFKRACSHDLNVRLGSDILGIWQRETHAGFMGRAGLAIRSVILFGTLRLFLVVKYEMGTPERANTSNISRNARNIDLQTLDDVEDMIAHATPAQQDEYLESINHLLNQGMTEQSSMFPELVPPRTGPLLDSGAEWGGVPYSVLVHATPTIWTNLDDIMGGQAYALVRQTPRIRNRRQGNPRRVRLPRNRHPEPGPTIDWDALTREITQRVNTRLDLRFAQTWLATMYETMTNTHTTTYNASPGDRPFVGFTGMGFDWSQVTYLFGCYLDDFSASVHFRGVPAFHLMIDLITSASDYHCVGKLMDMLDRAMIDSNPETTPNSANYRI